MFRFFSKKTGINKSEVLVECKTKPIPKTSTELIIAGYIEMLEHFNNNEGYIVDPFIPQDLNEVHRFVKMSNKLNVLLRVFESLNEITEENNDIVRFAVDSLRMDSFAYILHSSNTPNIVEDVYRNFTGRNFNSESIKSYLKEVINRHTCPIY